MLSHGFIKKSLNSPYYTFNPVDWTQDITFIYHVYITYLINSKHSTIYLGCKSEWKDKRGAWQNMFCAHV